MGLLLYKIFRIIRKKSRETFKLSWLEELVSFRLSYFILNKCCLCIMCVYLFSYKILGRKSSLDADQNKIDLFECMWVRVNESEMNRILIT